jgi:hypothetical protein
MRCGGAAAHADATGVADGTASFVKPNVQFDGIA